MSQSQYYPRRERERDYEGGSSAGANSDYTAGLYQRAQRAARNGSSFSPPASPNYEFTRQRTWSGATGGGNPSSYESREHGFPIREHPRERERERDMMDLPGSASPQTPTYGLGSGGMAGSFGRRERNYSTSSRYEVRERERDVDRDRDRDRGVRGGRGGDREYFHSDGQGESDPDTTRQRLLDATQYYPRRLREYVQPMLQNPQALETLTGVFVKLDQDPRYLAVSIRTLLETLAAAADDAANSNKGSNGSNGTGLDDPATDSEFTEESALDDSESVVESDEDSSDDASGGIGGGTGFLSGAARRRSSVANNHHGHHGPSNSTSSRRGSLVASPSPALMQWSGFRPCALSKALDGVSDRRKSFLALTQTIVSTQLLNSQLSTKGLLAELLRVLQPRDYRAYFRASARVILLPIPGPGVSVSAGHRHLEELALEAMERQLLGTAKFCPGTTALAAAAAASAAAAAAATSGSASATIPSSPSPLPTMMACITYSSACYGSISLYRLDMVPTREGTEWPRRIQPVSVMTGVPKELLRCTARAVPPSRRTVLKVKSSGGGGGGRRDSLNGGGTASAAANNTSSSSAPLSSSASSSSSASNASSASLRWVSLPADTTVVPSLGYSPNVGRSALPPDLLEALALEPDDLKIAPNTTANVVNATVPAMLAWLHVRAAYLSNVEFEGTEVQRGGAGGSSTKESSNSSSNNRESFSSKDRDRKGKDRDRDRDRRDRDRARDRDDDTASTTTQRGRIRRIVRWKRGPTPVEHEGRDPCIVVLHPSRGEWVTSPVYWTELKDGSKE